MKCYSRVTTNEKTETTIFTCICLERVGYVIISYLVMGRRNQ